MFSRRLSSFKSFKRHAVERYLALLKVIESSNEADQRLDLPLPDFPTSAIVCPGCATVKLISDQCLRSIIIGEAHIREDDTPLQP